MKKIFKKTALFVVSLFIASSITIEGALADDTKEIEVYVNETKMEFDVSPRIENDRTLVPMRAIFETLGASIQWDEDSRTVTAVKETHVIKITIDNPVMIKNNEEVPLEVPAKIIEDRTMVPIRAVSEGLDALVEWDADTRRVLITTSLSTPLPSPTPTGTTVPEATPIPQATNNPSEVSSQPLSHKKLSKADMINLKNSYSNLRYAFEQKTLPSYALIGNEELLKNIQEETEQTKFFAGAVWNQMVVSQIIKIQTESETVYDVKEATSQEIIQDYLNIVEKAGMGWENYFDVSFETLKNQNTMLLLSFKDTDSFLACKYIGIVATADNKIHYFTAETDASAKENLFFCEIATTSRGTLGIIGLEKADFIAMADKVLSVETK